MMTETQGAECRMEHRQLLDLLFKASDNVRAMAKESPKFNRRVQQLTQCNGSVIWQTFKRIIFYKGKNIVRLCYNNYKDSYAGVDLDTSSYGSNPPADTELKEFLEMLTDAQRTEDFFENIETTEKQRRGFLYHILFPLRCMSKMLYYFGLMMGLFIPPFFLLTMLGVIIYPDKVERELMAQRH